MKKISVLVVALFIIFAAQKANAAVLTQPFGGRILYTKAVPIQTLEAANYSCIVPGTSIFIQPVTTGPTNFLIPVGVVSKTSTTARPAQWILGNYSNIPAPITCVFRGWPFNTQVVNLQPLQLYGTSL